LSLGKRLQELRRRRGLTATELATRVQVTSGFISQLEHGRTSPSLETLQRLAQTLQVPLTYLLQDDNPRPHVVRKQERHIIQLGSSGLRASFLSPLPQRHLELVLLELPPGKLSWTKSGSHEGEECHLVLKGALRAYYGDETYLLEEGDSILWDSTVPRRMENVGESEAQLLIALSPPVFLPLEPSEE